MAVIALWRTSSNHVIGRLECTPRVVDVRRDHDRVTRRTTPHSSGHVALWSLVPVPEQHECML